MNEQGQKLEREAARQLREAGYAVSTEHKVPTLGKRTARIDVVALTADVDGILKPAFIVEVKVPTKSNHLQSALAQLQFYAPLLDVDTAYIFDGEWHRASADFTAYSKATVPPARTNLTEAIASPGLLTRMVWDALDSNRGPSRPEVVWSNLLALLAGDEPEGETRVAPELLQLASNAKNRATIASILAEAQQELGPAGGESTTNPKLTAAMARLLNAHDGWGIADPFSGLGGCLRAVAMEGRGRGVAYRLEGTEINATTRESAQRLLSLLGVGATLRTEDSLKESTTQPVDAVVSAPPFGLRLQGPYSLSSGEVTKDGNLAVVDLCYSLLRPGGRAVLLLSAGFFFAGGQAQRYREYLQGNARIAAIIALPPNLLKNTSIKTTILVVEKRTSSRTLVARLEDDWEGQLEEGGDFLSAYRKHMEEEW